MMKRVAAHVGLSFAAFACAAPGSQPSLAARPSQSPLRSVVVVSERLASGYRVVIAKTPPVSGQTPRVYVASYALFGSMQDEPFGVAHLMEHVVANNASTIAEPPRDPAIKILNGNALTRPYYTSFVTVIPPELLAS